MFEEFLYPAEQFRFVNNDIVHYYSPEYGATIIREKGKYSIRFKDFGFTGIADFNKAQQVIVDIVKEYKFEEFYNIEPKFKKISEWSAIPKHYPFVKHSPLTLYKTPKGHWYVYNRIFSTLPGHQHKIKTFKTRIQAIEYFYHQLCISLPDMYRLSEQRSPGLFEKEFNKLTEENNYSYKGWKEKHVWWLLFLKPDKQILPLLQSLNQN